MAKTTNAASEAGRVDISVKAALFQNHVFPHDQTMGSHFLQCGQDAVHVLVRIDENNDHWKFSSRVDEVAGLDSMSTKKAGYRMKCGCRVHILSPQIVENFHVQRPMVPLVGFVEVDCDLNSHRVWHFTAPAPMPSQPVYRQGIADCC